MTLDFICYKIYALPGNIIVCKEITNNNKLNIYTLILYKYFICIGKKGLWENKTILKIVIIQQV